MGMTEKYALIAVGDRLTLPASTHAQHWRVIRIHTETQTIQIEPLLVKSSLGVGPWQIEVHPTRIPEID